MDDLQTFISRLSKIGIKLNLFANYPWIYIDRVNGNKIPKSEWNENHGYNLGFMNKRFDFVDLEKTFNLIRKYKDERDTRI